MIMNSQENAQKNAKLVHFNASSYLSSSNIIVMRMRPYIGTNAIQLQNTLFT